MKGDEKEGLGGENWRVSMLYAAFMKMAMVSLRNAISG